MLFSDKHGCYIFDTYIDLEVLKNYNVLGIGKPVTVGGQPPFLKEGFLFPPEKGG